MPRGGMRYDGGIGICISVKDYFNRIFRFTLFFAGRVIFVYYDFGFGDFVGMRRIS